MSKIQITAPPPCPEGVDSAAWAAEWVGLEVTEASELSRSVGYLGQRRDIWDDSTKLFRSTTPDDNMNELTRDLCKENWWFIHRALVYACKRATPPRRLILEWLEAPCQVGRSIFAIPKYQAEHLP